MTDAELNTVLDEVAGPERLFDPAAVRFGRFMDTEPPERRYLLDDVLPLNVAGLIGAIGGTGKSALIYQLAMSVVTGVPFLGLRVGEVGGALYLAAEDDEGELHRRGWALYRHLCSLGHAVDAAALAERLHIVSRVGHDNLLTRAGLDGEAVRTPLVDRLVATAREIPDLKLIAIEPVSRWRGGNANSEEHVTRFVEAVEAVRDSTGATVICAAHATKASALTGDTEQGMVRGSSALVDGFRWVATMQRMTPQQSEKHGIDPEERRRYLRLEVPKSNYTAPFPGLWLERLAGGVLAPAPLTEVPADERREAHRTAAYRETLRRLVALIRDQGPMSRRRVRDFAGTKGVLGAGDHSVRTVIERAVAEGELTDADGVLDIPGGSE